ncbi:unnamed protein product [Ranitomeya imitator]|uniref:Uncharacterized protein n=1 Tax=Ranitomeya imitator TaxID=111125 RepID=A0ABN9KNL2_9NEOB|nr:unnamed protein product [Ranitomeya imitator]
MPHRTRTAAGPPLGEYNITCFSHLSGYIGGLSTALQNAVDKPLMLDPDNYLIIWIIADVVAFIHIIWAFLVLRACFRKKEDEESETVLLMKIESLVA